MQTSTAKTFPTSRPNLHNPYYTAHLLLAAFPALENSAPTLDAFRTVPLVWEGCLNANATDMELTWVSKRKLVSTAIKRERSEESGQRKEKKTGGISTKFNQVDESPVYCCGLPTLPMMTAKKKKVGVGGSYPTNSCIWGKFFLKNEHSPTGKGNRDCRSLSSEGGKSVRR